MDQNEPKYPINYVARLTGLTPYAIRIWERRHQVTQPQRTASGHRLYSDAQIDRLRLLRRATQAGHAIGKISHLNEDDLRKIVRDTIEPPTSNVRSDLKDARLGTPQAQLLEKCQTAVLSMDRDQLDALLAQGAGNLACIDFLEFVVSPLMQWVGDQWHDGGLRIANEHMATASIRAYLERLYVSLRSAQTGPGVVLTTLPGHRHEIGILSCAVISVLEGWRAHYFGLELPLAEIAQSASDLKVRLVALSVSNIGTDHDLLTHLAELRDLLPSEIGLFVGGAGAAAIEDNLKPLGIRCVGCLRQFQEILRTH